MSNKIINTPDLLKGLTFGATSPSKNVVYLSGNDPSLIINPQKIGRSSYRKSDIWKSLKAREIKNGLLNQKDPTQLVFIGETNGANKLYINPQTKKPEYMLHPSAAKAWFKWRDEMNSKGIAYRVSSGYRSSAHQSGLGSGPTVASPGSSPHGVGGALDFGNLYGIVDGVGSPSSNAQGRLSKQYQDIAKAGANHFWYNPWRLADSRGVDEIWHFEYWGPL